MEDLSIFFHMWTLYKIFYVPLKLLIHYKENFSFIIENKLFFHNIRPGHNVYFSNFYATKKNILNN